MSYLLTSLFQILASWYAQGHCRVAVRNTNLGVVLFVIILILTGCNQGIGSTPRPGAVYREETVTLPTPAPTVEPTPINTRVLPLEVLTPPPSPTITPIPDEVMGLVVDVLAGDVIAVVLDGDPASRAYQVRYIGIDAPKNFSGDPWGVVAYETNQALVKLKIVRLVRDQTDFDAEGYLLRHVYLDNQLLSLVLVERGLAKAALEEPNTRFEKEILRAEARAKQEQLGLWGQKPPTPTLAASEPASSEEEETPETPVATPPTATRATSTREAEPTKKSTAELTATGTVEVTPQPTAQNTPDSE